ncbi:hypothetical protein [Psychromonas ossibalaenae]|uniref:hypothetical protein n=1 Tax=Psychromonas ossibalaenae TaxID=444922 RepID=UPI000370C9B4|nr:hypothetical protein [Psychromonas ossibalaenae]
MRIQLQLFFSLILLFACGPAKKFQSNNQFTFNNGGLYFSQRLISDWGKDVAVPVCKECSKHVYTAYTPTGPMLFRQVNNGRGDLIFFYAANAQHSFALNTGSGQYMAHLQLKNKKLYFSVNEESIELKLNEQNTFQFGSQSYFVSLKKIKFIEARQPDSKSKQATFIESSQAEAQSKPMDYRADILIWLNPQNAAAVKS